MIRELKILLVAMAIPLLLVSCKKEEPAVPPPVKKAQSAPAQAPMAAAEAVPKPAPVEPGIEGKHRNPFLSYIVLMKGVEGARKIKGPLECCELALFRLVAVVAGIDNPAALVQAPDGRRYVVKRNDIIGAREGRIVKIGDRSVTVREFARDEFGKVTTSADVELRLPEKESEGQKQR